MYLLLETSLIQFSYPLCLTPFNLRFQAPDDKLTTIQGISLTFSAGGLLFFTGVGDGKTI